MHVLNSLNYFFLSNFKQYGVKKKRKKNIPQLFWIDQTVQITLTTLLMYIIQAALTKWKTSYIKLSLLL